MVLVVECEFSFVVGAVLVDAPAESRAAAIQLAFVDRGSEVVSANAYLVFLADIVFFLDDLP